MGFLYRWSNFILDMNKRDINKTRILQFIQMLMYLDALLMVFSLGHLNHGDSPYQHEVTPYIRLVVLFIVFGVLYAVEKNISREFKKRRNN